MAAGKPTLASLGGHATKDRSLLAGRAVYITCACTCIYTSLGSSTCASKPLESSSSDGPNSSTRRRSASHLVRVRVGVRVGARVGVGVGVGVRVGVRVRVRVPSHLCQSAAAVYRRGSGSLEVVALQLCPPVPG